MGEVEPSRHHVSILIGQLEGGLSWMKWSKKWGRGKFIFHATMSCNYVLHYVLFVENLIG